MIIELIFVYFLFHAELIQLLLQTVAHFRIFRVAVEVVEFVRIALQIIQFVAIDCCILIIGRTIKMNQFVAVIAHSVVAANHVYGRIIIVVVVKILAPVLGCFATEEWNQ